MELREYSNPSLKKTGVTTFTIAAGKTLRIETTPDGVELLEVEVPAGKTWEVSIVLDIDETDA